MKITKQANQKRFKKEVIKSLKEILPEDTHSILVSFPGGAIISGDKEELLLLFTLLSHHLLCDNDEIITKEELIDMVNLASKKEVEVNELVEKMINKFINNMEEIKNEISKRQNN